MSERPRAVKRTYDSTLRQAQARTTRRTIIDAASRLFATQGYIATSIDQIAEAAGVGRATVFAAVGSKPALLEAAWDIALVGDDEPVALPDRPESQEIMADPDPRRFLSRYVALVVEIAVRSAAIYEAVRAAAPTDPLIASLFKRMQAGRYMGATHVAELLQAKDGLRPGLTVEAAADILWSLLEPLLYQLLVQERHWSVEQYRDWLDETLQTQLLAT